MKNFSRRSFVQSAGLGALALTLPSFSSGYQRTDKFGGIRAIKFKPSGFFRIEKGDRWWLVTPEGSGFISYGLNHTDLVYLQQEYNKDFWIKKFGASGIDDQAFRQGFINKVFSDLDKFGMNTLGCHGKKEVFGKITVPYLQGLFFAPTAYWALRGVQGYPDVWSDTFRAHCEKISETICLPKVNDPYLLGYTFTNVPILTDLDAEPHGIVPWGAPQVQRPTWPRALRNRAADTPGKKKYVELIRERYGSVSDFNASYKTHFTSFDELLNAVNWSPFEKHDGIDDHDDNHAFMLQIYDQYYRVTTRAIRDNDPNHLLFGDPINANTGTTDDIISLVVKHTDLLSYQHYGPYDEQKPILDHWSELTGRPIFNTDSNFTAVGDHMPDPVGWICKDQQTRADYFLDFASRAIARPDFLGWNWCGWVDAWKEWKPVQQHNGLQDPFGNYHDPMPETMSLFGSQLYSYALGKRRPFTISKH